MSAVIGNRRGSTQRALARGRICPRDMARKQRTRRPGRTLLGPMQRSGYLRLPRRYRLDEPGRCKTRNRARGSLQFGNESRPHTRSARAKLRSRRSDACSNRHRTRRRTRLAGTRFGTRLEHRFADNDRARKARACPITLQYYTIRCSSDRPHSAKYSVRTCHRISPPTGDRRKAAGSSRRLHRRALRATKDRPRIRDTASRVSILARRRCTARRSSPDCGRRSRPLAGTRRRTARSPRVRHLAHRS